MTIGDENQREPETLGSMFQEVFDLVDESVAGITAAEVNRELRRVHDLLAEQRDALRKAILLVDGGYVEEAMALLRRQTEAGDQHAAALLAVLLIGLHRRDEAEAMLRQANVDWSDVDSLNHWALDKGGLRSWVTRLSDVESYGLRNVGLQNIVDNAGHVSQSRQRGENRTA